MPSVALGLVDLRLFSIALFGLWCEWFLSVATECAMMATTPVCGEGSLGCIRCSNESVVVMKMNTYFTVIFYHSRYFLL